MLKFLLILLIGLYVLSKIGKMLFWFAPPRQSYRRPPEGNANSAAFQGKRSKNSSIKGGEYVDYEEVK